MQPPNHLPFSPLPPKAPHNSLSLSLSLSSSLSNLLCVMDAAQWPQGIGVECSRNVEKKPRPAQEQALNCPRCKSTNTKFCYYNNYSLSQPRYFCKTCRRYWTEGGTLRNVPVGGSSRKNKRSSNISTKKLIPEPDLSPPKFSPRQNPKIHDGGQDLSLSYNDPTLYNGISELVALPFALEAENLNPQNPNSSSSSMRGLISLPVSYPNSVISPAFKPSLSFSLDGVQNRFGNLQAAVQGDDPTSNSSRMIFPFEESRPLENDHSNGYWSGMLSGGSW